MATTYTTKTKMGKPAVADRQWHLALNENADRIEANANFSALAVTVHEVPSSTLAVSVAAGSFVGPGNTIVAYAGTASLSLAASSTIKIWLTAAGVLDQGAAYPSTAHVRLATVVTDATKVTSITDDRLCVAMTLQQTTGGAATAGASYTATEQGMLQKAYNALRANGLLT